MFNKFRQACNAHKKVVPFEGTLLALDPGETTGISVFHANKSEAKQVEAAQWATWPMDMCVPNLTTLFDQVQPSRVVMESYHVYEWKTDSHAWSDVPTLHIIGCIETLCIQRKIPYSFQTAQVAKNFCTDEKLKDWLFYSVGQRHARDASRHGAYFLLFGEPTPAITKK